MTFSRTVTTRYDASTVGHDRGTRRVEQQLARLERGANRRLTNIDRRLSQVSRGIGRFTGALVTAFGARAFLVGAERVAKALDDIGKTADRLGLSTDALQELRAAAADSGVAVQTTDLALQRFTRRTAEARAGTGEAKAALEELGIEFETADGRFKSVEELLNDVADAFTNVEDPADRVRLAFKLFDSEGVGFLNVLRNGAEGLIRVRQEARDTGQVIERSLVRQAEDTVTELGRLERQIDVNLARAFGNTQPLLVAWRQAWEAITGAIADATDELAAHQRAVSQFEARIGRQDQAARLAEAEANRADAQRRVGEARSQLQNARETENNLALVARFERSFLREVAAAGQAEIELNAVRVDLGLGGGPGARRGPRGPGGLPDRPAPAPLPVPRSEDDDGPGRRPRSGGGGRVRAVEDERDAYAELIETARERQRQLVDEIALIQASEEDRAFLIEQQRLLTEARQNDVALSEQVLAGIDAEARASAELSLRLADLESARRLIRDFGDQNLSTEEKLLRVRERMTALLPELTALTQDQAEAGRIVGAAISDASQDIIDDDPFVQLSRDMFSAIQTAQSLEDALERIGLQLLELAANEFISRAFGGGGGSGFGSILSGLGSTVLSFFGGAGGGGGAPIALRANGGPVRRGQPYIVGERQAELFVPDRNGVIFPSVPNIQVPNLGPSQNMTVSVGDTYVTINRPGASDADIERRLRQHREGTVGLAVRKVAEINDRDPDFLKT